LIWFKSSDSFIFKYIGILFSMEWTVLQKYLINLVDADLKIILLDHQNNYIERSYNCWNVKTFCNIAHYASVAYVIILMVQQNYFQISIWLNFYTSTKLFFPWRYKNSSVVESCVLDTKFLAFLYDSNRTFA